MPEYDFRTLSPADFEYFVCDLLNAELGLALHSYPEGRDRGIDLLQIRDDGHRTVVQCKHFLKSGAPKLVAAARKEVAKWGRKSADEYMFVTSQEVNSSLESKIMDILGIPHRNVWGQEQLNHALERHPEVERRHPKLWLSSTAALDAILKAGCWNRSDAHFEQACDRARFWVETPHFAQVIDVLERTGSCTVAGPPGVGKTFLSEMVTLRYAHEKWEVIYVHDIRDAWDVLARDTRRQLFYYNDFLGEIKLDASPAAASDISRFMETVALRRDHKRLLVSSRLEVLQEAALKPSAHLKKIARNVRHRFDIELTRWEEPLRRQVVLNHFHFAGMPEHELRAAARDRRLTSVVRHPSFNPRLIEAICHELDDEPAADHAFSRLMNALAYPESIWEVSFSALEPSAEEILLTLATLRPRAVPMPEVRELVSDMSRASEWNTIVSSLVPTWVTITHSAGQPSLSLANPSCREYLIGKIGSDRMQADERVERASTLEQLAELARGAGELIACPGPSPLTNRASIANALSHRRDDVARRVRHGTAAELAKAPSQPAKARTLTTTAALLARYGAEDDHIWLADQVAGFLGDGAMEHLPTTDALALAARLTSIPPVPGLAVVTNKLTLSAVASVRTLRDLDAYTTFAGGLNCGDATETVRPMARRILTAELEQLFDETSAELVRDTATELKARAAFFGLTANIEDLLDHALELDTQD